eukprot:gnl/Trimastix_PCT/1580.p1 GENE.gnl/Trimastix_PCT/1580~~gnl/Trimastix_PCT/1580.p1  ORF type:complete len:929 (-),score=310.30 gnl/Trimastix_PCT/1580:734-3139(-)
MELNPERLKGDEAAKESILEGNCQRLLTSASKLLEKLTPMTTIFPRELRALASRIAYHAEAHRVPNRLGLVGGFVFLRFINPALVAPEAFDILLPLHGTPSIDARITPTGRRNLVLITKLLQNLSNGVEFGTKEAYMIRANRFITEHRARMESYLNEICCDRRASAADTPWADVMFLPMRALDISRCNMPDFLFLHRMLYRHGPRILDNLRTRTATSVSQLGAPSPRHASPLREASTPACPSTPLSTQAPTAAHSPPLASSSSLPGASPLRRDNNAGADADTDTPHASASASPPPPPPVLTQMHPPAATCQPSSPLRRPAAPPSREGEPTRPAVPPRPRPFHERRTSCPPRASRPAPLPPPPVSLSNDIVAADASFAELIRQIGPPPGCKEAEPPQRVDALLEAAYEALFANREHYCTAALQEANFFYQGEANRDGLPVFYLIANRVREEHFIDSTQLLVHLIKVMGLAINGPYAVLIDMSWASLRGATRTNVFSFMRFMSASVSHNQRKNLKAVYLVHPNTFTRVLIWLMRAFTSGKLSRKIHELDDWRALERFIEPSALRLPEESRSFIAKAYRVTKVNHKGKQQIRHIKLTTDSLLNIEGKSNKIQNERLLTEIDEILGPPDSPELVILFGDRPAPASSRIGFFPAEKSTDADRRRRRYVCASVQQRDEILEDIFETAVRAGSITLPQAFRVVEMIGPTKRALRVLKLTADSALLLNGRAICEEIHLTSIQSVRVQDGCLWVHLKMNGVRQLRCSDAAEAKRAIDQRIRINAEALREVRDSIAVAHAEEAVVPFAIRR